MHEPIEEERAQRRTLRRNAELIATQAKLQAAEARLERYREALEFYANPETYFAIGFLPDPPCGEFIEDFDETPDLGFKPGKHAREALAPDASKEA